jgi:hypothetical protein
MSQAPPQSSGEFLLYSGPDGRVKVECRFKDETLWLTQRLMADLFGVGVPAINKHLKNIFESGELAEASTLSKMEMVRAEGSREVRREVDFYNLDAIIAVGYRVNSYQATQFRTWATRTLKEFIDQWDSGIFRQTQAENLAMTTDQPHAHGSSLASCVLQA